MTIDIIFIHDAKILLSAAGFYILKHFWSAHEQWPTLNRRKDKNTWGKTTTDIINITFFRVRAVE